VLAGAAVVAASAGTARVSEGAVEVRSAGAAASAAVRWREVNRGEAVGPALSVPVTFVALDRAATKRFSYRLPSKGKRALAGVDYGRNAVVAVFAQFGCKDPRIDVASMKERAGGLLLVLLAEKPLAAGTMECQAIYPVYRLLAVPKASLSRPYPTRSEARLR
jgi:hypothetical protein